MIIGEREGDGSRSCQHDVNTRMERGKERKGKRKNKKKKEKKRKENKTRGIKGDKLLNLLPMHRKDRRPCPSYVSQHLQPSSSSPSPSVAFSKLSSFHPQP